MGLLAKLGPKRIISIIKKNHLVNKAYFNLGGYVMLISKFAVLLPK